MNEMNETAEGIETTHERAASVSKSETTTPTCKVSSPDGNEYKPMTLDEAIAHAEEAANDTPCGREHRQLAGWLKKLREIKTSNTAKMHEALESISAWAEANLRDYGADWMIHNRLCDMLKSALAAPPLPIGNNAKMREALKEIEGYAWVHGLWEIEPIAKAALAETPRNCDVGTEREQSRRFDSYCYAHKTYEYGCRTCPLLSSVCCELAWAQLPYKEGDPK